MKVSKSHFGRLPDGQAVFIFTLQNDNGLEVNIINYGAIISSILFPDRDGNRENIVCGFDKLEDYLSQAYLSNYPYFGSIIGRVGNRIKNGRFTLEGKEYQLAVNNGPNHLHGGITGFDKRLWRGECMVEEEKAGVLFSYFSPDMEENYPGNLEVSCLYSINNNNELSIDYFGTSDQTTIINLTNHTYFNLTGGKENILGHELALCATHITESVNLIPTGKLLPVEGTPFDFIQFKRLGSDLEELKEGYDTNFVLDNEDGNLIYAGCLREQVSGRQVEVFTSQPGIQLYTGYWIPELMIDGRKKFGSFSGVALETQHYPDSINHPSFPPVILEAGKKYSQTTVYRFGHIGV